MGKKFTKKMSEKQLEANRRNAQKSTGPHNTENTRYNAEWHGFRGTRVVINGESMEEYLAFAKTIYQYFAPLGTYEHSLVKLIADGLWEVERADAMKAQVLNNAEYRDVRDQELVLLQRYRNSIFRNVMQTRRELYEVQAARGKILVTGAQYRAQVRRSKHHTQPPQAEAAPQPQQQQPTLHKGQEALFETVTYMGAATHYPPSQGEIAIERLIELAKDRMRRNATPDGKTSLDAWVDKQADLDLAMEGCSEPPPEENEPDDDAKDSAS